MYRGFTVSYFLFLGDRMSRLESPGSPPDSGLSSSHSTGVRRRLGRQAGAMTGPDTKVLIVWLETFQDKDNFPTGERKLSVLLSLSHTH